MKLRNILFFFVAAGFLAGCKKFDDYKENNNQPVNVPPSLILRGIENDMSYHPFDQVERNNQFTCSNYIYYDDNTYWSGSASLSYTTLNNVVSMEDAATKAAGSTNNPYNALGKFFRAYFFYDMTMKVGDLPMNEALQRLNNQTPKYDEQKVIFQQIFSWLDSSNSQLTDMIENGFLEFSGDFYFKERINGGLSPRDALIAWQKVVNTFRLRVLIELSKHSGEADLNVPGQFKDIISNSTKYPILTGMDDNLQYVYNSTYNYYPNNTLNFGNDATRYNMAATYLNTLASLKDLRAMKVAEPARGLGFPDIDFRSFVGAPTGQDLSNMASDIQRGLISLIGRHRYYETLTGENTFLVSYPEMCFNIAEAANRGWITGVSSEEWYNNGIKAMFSFFGVNDGANTVTFQKAGGLLGDDVTYNVTFNYAEYFAQPAVKYAGDNATGLNQILTQKYLAYARNSGLQAYYQYRRTGVPVFSQGPGVGNSGIIPDRYQYPVNERSANEQNYNDALTRQFGAAGDDIFQPLWIVK